MTTAPDAGDLAHLHERLAEETKARLALEAETEALRQIIRAAGGVLALVDGPAMAAACRLVGGEDDRPAEVA